MSKYIVLGYTRQIIGDFRKPGSTTEKMLLTMHTWDNLEDAAKDAEAIEGGIVSKAIEYTHDIREELLDDPA